MPGPTPATRSGTGGRLNDRDLELLRLLAEGGSTARAAAAMAVSTNTVRTRLRRVQRKLDAADRDQVLRRVRDLGIV